MPMITQEDFTPVYMDVRKHSAADDTWPKIVQWALPAPLQLGEVQVLITVLQRQHEPYGAWEFIASITPSTVSERKNAIYGEMDPYVESGGMTLPPMGSFDACIDAVMTAIEERY